MQQPAEKLGRKFSPAILVFFDPQALGIASRHQPCNRRPVAQIPTAGHHSNSISAQPRPGCTNEWVFEIDQHAGCTYTAWPVSVPARYFMAAFPPGP